MTSSQEIFIKNRYYNFYFNIIKLAKSKNRIKDKDHYFESHHIFPKAFGGTNEKYNLVLLTAREHFIVHACLTRCTRGQYKHKMIKALMFFNGNSQNNYTNSIIYEANRIAFSKAQSGNNHWTFGLKKEDHPLYGRKLSYETKKKISLKTSGANNYSFGKIYTEEEKLKLSISMKNNLNIKGSNNYAALKIGIYDNEGILQYSAHGNFAEVCKENNLPDAVLRRSYQNGGEPIFQKRKYKKYQHLIGWYAKLINN